MEYKATVSELHTLVALHFPEIEDDLNELSLSEDEPEQISVWMSENRKREPVLSHITIWTKHFIFNLDWHSSFDTGKHYFHTVTRMPDKTASPVPKEYLQRKENV